MSPDELSGALASFPALGALRPADRELLRSRGAIRTLPAGAVYLREGDTCAGMALVLAGRLRVSKSSGEGREITLYHIGAGETCILSASCVLAPASYPALATVVEDVTALLVPADLFRQLVATYEPVRSFVFAHFGDRLATVMALVQEVAFARVDRRVATWLAREADVRGTAVIPVSHEEIANQLGTARVVVSRVMEGFADRRWITQGRRKVEVLDAGALRAYGNQSD